MGATESVAGLVNWRPAERRHRSGLVTWSQVGAPGEACLSSAILPDREQIAACALVEGDG